MASAIIKKNHRSPLPAIIAAKLKHQFLTLLDFKGKINIQKNDLALLLNKLKYKY